MGPYDVWLADEHPSPETLRWCEDHGVKVITRRSIDGYHRPSWPRRTRSKEGNLAFFYDYVGYGSYDVVAQFDADHVPSPTYLREILPGFADPRVGYVAAPSICDTNAAGSWAARGRLYREATFHGPAQAGSNDGLAPACIGSHYAVRTQALRKIGGIGPDLAEDFSTSFLMHAHGWKGAFALNAIAHGEGPETFADAMTQELQWSRSIVLFMLRYSGPHWKNLNRSERWKFAYCQLWYPLLALQMSIGVTYPFVAVLRGTPWVSVDLLEYLLRASLPGLVATATVMWIRARGWLRPHNAPTISWESALFQIARWPWVTLGVLQGVYGALTKQEINFKVTPKGSGRQPFPVRIIAPYLAITALGTAAAVTLPIPAPVRGYRLLVLLTAVLYATVAFLVPVLHRRENGLVPGVERASNIGSSALVTAIAAIATRTPLAPFLTSTSPAALVVYALSAVAVLTWRHRLRAIAPGPSTRDSATDPEPAARRRITARAHP